MIVVQYTKLQQFTVMRKRLAKDQREGVRLLVGNRMYRWTRA